MLEDLTPPVTVWSCKVRVIREQLDEADATILMMAVENHALWPANTLSKELRKRGLLLGDTTITKHRAKLCSCFKDA